MKSENERLRALLAEAQHAMLTKDDDLATDLVERIDAALAEPDVDDRPVITDPAEADAALREWASHFDLDGMIAEEERERDAATAEAERLQRIEMERDRAVQAMKVMEGFKDAALRERDEARAELTRLKLLA